jgi:ubiquinone/menaquinone biosynthesis C-methylase UbiE
VADAEALPFAGGSFDVALSTFGVMFTPSQEKAAAELVRVVRKGGKIGLASWTPDGFIGRVLKLVGKYMPPPAGTKPAILWGTEARLAELFQGHEIHAWEQAFTFRYESPEHWVHMFRKYYGPTNRAFASLDAEKAAALEADILDLLESSNRGGKGSLIVPGHYLEVVFTRA